MQIRKQRLQALSSPLKIGDTYENMQRKLIAFQGLDGAASSSSSSSSGGGGGGDDDGGSSEGNVNDDGGVGASATPRGANAVIRVTPPTPEGEEAVHHHRRPRSRADGYEASVSAASSSSYGGQVAIAPIEAPL